MTTAIQAKQAKEICDFYYSPVFEQELIRASHQQGKKYVRTFINGKPFTEKTRYGGRLE